jgi:UTP:GlnB (protein PII) uridylyltransferase
MATVNDVRSLLAETSMPQEVIGRFLDVASAVWLLSAPAEVLAHDLVLCHPPIGTAEVRAMAHPLDGGGIRLTVVAHDRPGLLADTAAVLAREGLSVSSASAMTWAGSGLAMHAVTILGAHLTDDRWAQLGRQLRSVGAEEAARVSFEPVGRATVRSSPSTMGRCVVTVTAPDQVGLLWAICRWFADNGVSIEAARIGAEHGRARDHFIVVGDPVARALAAHLAGAPPTLPELAADVAAAGASLVAGMARRLAGR